MKRFLIQVLILSPMIIWTISSCGGNGGGGGGGTTEVNLAVTLNPPVGSTQPPLPQADFPLTVTVTSTMPPQGVTIDVKAAPDGSATNFFTDSKTTSATATPFTITATPIGPVCVVTVTVTSKSKASNTWTGNFRYSRKS